MDKNGYSPELFLQQIQKLAEIHGLKFPRGFEKEIGMRGAVSSWEPLDKEGNPKKKYSIPSVDTLLKIKKLFNVSIDWLLTGEKPTTKEILQPVISTADSLFSPLPGFHSENFIAVPQVEGRLAAKHARAIPSAEIKSLFCLYFPGLSPFYYKNLLAVQVADNYHAMEPTILAGDVVIIDTSAVTPTSRGIYAVRAQDGEECDINRVYPSDKWIVISSDNPKYAPRILPPDQAQQVIIGRVLWSWTSWVY